MLDRFVQRLDETDIERARQFSKANPANFTVRREKYLDYLKAHAEGGRFLSEWHKALDAIDHDRDLYLYRQAYDHAISHPDDVPVIAGRLRSVPRRQPATASSPRPPKTTSLVEIPGAGRISSDLETRAG